MYVSEAPHGSIAAALLLGSTLQPRPLQTVGVVELQEVCVAVVSRVEAALMVVGLVYLLPQLAVLATAREVQGPGKLQGSLVRAIQPLQNLVKDRVCCAEI